MKTVEQDYIIDAPIKEVWLALTDAAYMERWEAGPAKSDAREGGEFSLWDGDIHGTYTKLVPEKLIEQDWYGHNNPTWKYTLSFSLEPKGDGTNVHMIYSGDIVDEQKDIADWRDYYFDPIKKLVEQKV